MTLTELYNKYKTETDLSKSYVYKTCYILNGGKKLNTTKKSPLDMYYYTAGCLIRNYIKYNKKGYHQVITNSNTLQSRLENLKFNITDILRILENIPNKLILIRHAITVKEDGIEIALYADNNYSFSIHCDNSTTRQEEINQLIDLSKTLIYILLINLKLVILKESVDNSINLMETLLV